MRVEWLQHREGWGGVTGNNRHGRFGKNASHPKGSCFNGRRQKRRALRETGFSQTRPSQHLPGTPSSLPFCPHPPHPTPHIHPTSPTPPPTPTPTPTPTTQLSRPLRAQARRTVRTRHGARCGRGVAHGRSAARRTVRAWSDTSTRYGERCGRGAALARGTAHGAGATRARWQLASTGATDVGADACADTYGSNRAWAEAWAPACVVEIHWLQLLLLPPPLAFFGGFSDRACRVSWRLLFGAGEDRFRSSSPTELLTAERELFSGAGWTLLDGRVSLDFGISELGWPSSSGDDG